MAANGNGNKSVVVLQLSGGNDALNTVIPYADRNYYDNRQYLGIPENEVLHLDDKLGPEPGHGAYQVAVGRGQGGGHQRHRLPKPEQVAFPLDGRVAHRRAERHSARRLAGTGGARPRSEGRERGDRRQLRDAGCRARCTRRTCPWPRSATWIHTVLCPDIKDERARAVAPGSVLADIRRIGQGHHLAVHQPGGNGRAEGRGHSEDSARQLLVQRGVRGQPYRGEHEEHSAGDVRGRRHSRLLHPARQFRHSRERTLGARQAVERSLDRRRGLHGRPEGTRQGQGHGGADVLRVRSAHQGQRRGARTTAREAWRS